MGSLARWLVPFALLALAAGAPSQQRKPCFVTLVDADDQPLAHAEVTLIEVGHVGADAPDVARAFTDNRGRAQPEVLVGRLYCASAMADAAADGSRLVSEPSDRGACGIVLELMAMYRVAPRPLRLVDSEATREHWSRGLHVLGPDGQSTSVLPVDAEGMATLPPSPWAPLPIGMRDANGALLQAVRVEANVAAPTISFPKPTMMPLEITGADGKPAAGATASVVRWTMFADSLFDDVGTVLCPVMARADASGLLEVPLGPWTAGRYGSGWLRIENAGCGVRYVPAHVDAGQPALAVPLEDPRIATGTLDGVRKKERAVAQLRLTLTHRTPGLTSSMVLPIDVGIAGKQMRAVLPTGITEHQLTIRLTPDDNTATPRIAVLAPGRPGDLTELPDVDLATLRRLALRIVAPNGDLAASAKIVVVRIPDRVGERLRHRTRVIADLAGRAEILLGQGDWGIYMVHGTNHAWLFVDRVRASGELEVKLEPLPVMTMRVLDADGKPLRGARVERQPDEPGDIGPGEAVREKMARDAIVGEFAEGLATQARSNRAGQLAVPVQDWVPWQMTLRARAGERVSAPFAIKPGRDLGDVVVK